MNEGTVSVVVHGFAAKDSQVRIHHIRFMSLFRFPLKVPRIFGSYRIVDYCVVILVVVRISTCSRDESRSSRSSSSSSSSNSSSSSSSSSSVGGGSFLNIAVAIVIIIMENDSNVFLIVHSILLMR